MASNSTQSLADLMDSVLTFIEQRPRTRREIMIQFAYVRDHDMDVILATLEVGRIVEIKPRYSVIKRKTKG
jgi:hypothetical protein